MVHTIKTAAQDNMKTNDNLLYRQFAIVCANN